MAVYRSARLIILNSTDLLQAVLGFAALRGDWVVPPKQGDVIPEQATREWSIASSNLCLGAHAFLRLSCQEGYISIFWQNPWTGIPTIEVSAPHSIEHSYKQDNSDPNNTIYLLTVTQRSHLHHKASSQAVP